MAADTTPAYPRTGYNDSNPSFDTSPQEGMMIADVFAKQAFDSIYPVKAAKATVEDPVDYDALATECYLVAKAMIVARNAYIIS